MKTTIHVFLLFAIVGTMATCKSKSTEKLPVDLVNPFIGTGGHGHTYPGASMPFGMVQLSPDSRLTGWDGCSGYHYSDSVIFGFSHTHLSGTGIADYCDILIMPSTGDVKLSQDTALGIQNTYASGFDHGNEMAKPGYYSVKLNKTGIRAELTTTERTGFHRYTFPESESSHFILDLKHRDIVLASWIKIVNDSTIEGLRRSKSWASDQYVYFVAEFSKPFLKSEIFVNDSLLPNSKEADANHIKAAFYFKTAKDEQILVKVGISAVDTEGARKNLQSENPEWNFDQVAENARNTWSNELSKIVVEGGTQEQKTIFYTSLYHAMLSPNIFTDVDGRYRGNDLKIHQGENTNYYTVFSLWDTFRALHPLFTIIEQKRTNDFVNTFLNQYKQGGRLPVWELWANNTETMIGYHSIPVIVDAWAKGIKDYDISLAYEAMKFSAGLDHLGLAAYKKNGFIGTEDNNESVSKTLEYAYNDWCISKMAKALGNEEDYRHFSERSQAWKNLFDRTSGFMRPKHSNRWKQPFAPTEVDFNFTEANSWQYSFFVPHDIETLIQMHQGDAKFAAMLDTLFTTSSQTTGRHQSDITGLIGQYAHGNEPSHHMAYLYNFAGEPWKTQFYVNKILNEQYTALPDGLSGNEDCGQMSAWYVMSAMGFYQVTPGTTDYILGSPLFKKVTINLENGKQFIIEAPEADSKNIYIQSVELNGKEHVNSWITHSDIVNGGKILFTMGKKPNKNWGSKLENRPKSIVKDYLIMPVPGVVAESKIFKDSLLIALNAPYSDALIYYTTDGTYPGKHSAKFEKPFYINKTTTVKAMAIRGEQESKPISSEFYAVPKDRKITITYPFSEQYTAGGNDALIDVIRGGNDFRDGAWQGYQYDFEAIIEFEKEQVINSLAIGAIQEIGAWIFIPQYVEFYVSQDGKNYKQLGKATHGIADNHQTSVIHYFKEKNLKQKAKFVKVFAKNYGKLPDWHLGAGGQAWIFVDEIVIE
jgi:predicted alpha-1,2-mannosidase